MPFTRPSRRHQAGGIVALAGLALLVSASFESLARKRSQLKARAEIEAAAGDSFVKLDAAAERAPAAVRPRSRPRPGETVARIRIPSVDIDAVAFEGIDPSTLGRGAGHFPSTGLPGEPTNTAFAGHRDSFFRGLGGVRLGDPIEVRTGAATYTYRVTETRIVQPSQVEVVADRGRTELTLVTCYPFDYVGPAPRRFVLHAALAESS